MLVLSPGKEKIHVGSLLFYSLTRGMEKVGMKVAKDMIFNNFKIFDITLCFIMPLIYFVFVRFDFLKFNNKSYC